MNEVNGLNQIELLNRLVIVNWFYITSLTLPFSLTLPLTEGLEPFCLAWYQRAWYSKSYWVHGFIYLTWYQRWKLFLWSEIGGLELFYLTWYQRTRAIIPALTGFETILFGMVPKGWHVFRYSVFGLESFYLFNMIPKETNEKSGSFYFLLVYHYPIWRGESKVLV